MEQEQTDLLVKCRGNEEKPREEVIAFEVVKGETIKINSLSSSTYSLGVVLGSYISGIWKRTQV